MGAAGSPDIDRTAAAAVEPPAEAHLRIGSGTKSAEVAEGEPIRLSAAAEGELSIGNHRTRAGKAVGKMAAVAVVRNVRALLGVCRRNTAEAVEEGEAEVQMGLRWAMHTKTVSRLRTCPGMPKGLMRVQTAYMMAATVQRGQAAGEGSAHEKAEVVVKCIGDGRVDLVYSKHSAQGAEAEEHLNSAYSLTQMQSSGRLTATGERVVEGAVDGACQPRAEEK